MKQEWGIRTGFLSHSLMPELTKHNLPVCVSPSGTTSCFTDSGHLLCRWVRTTTVLSVGCGL